jgi:prophage tail gpP-like protein
VYVGGQLVLTGSVYTVEPTVKEDEIFINIEGFTNTVDIIDSNCEPPYERKNIKLSKLAYDMASPFGILVKDDVGGEEVFAKTTAEPTSTIFEFLAGLAKQRGVLLSSSPRGELLITKAKTGTKSVGSVGDELAISNDYSVRFDGRTRFSTYKVLSKRRGSTQTIAATSIDQNMVRRRLKVVQADDTTSTDAQKAADWERSGGMGESMSMPFPVSSWYAPDGTLWRENTIVTVTSPRLYIPYGFPFLITQVEYIFSEEGQPAILHLVPPQVYTGEQIEEPWHKYWKYRYSR